jgi:hypothetical protein
MGEGHGAFRAAERQTPVVCGGDGFGDRRITSAPPRMASRAHVGWDAQVTGGSTRSLETAARRPGVNTNLLTLSDLVYPLSGDATLTAIPAGVRPV